MAERLALLDVVRLTEDLPATGTAAGVVGTIVEVFESPHLAYEVEFTDDRGRPVLQTTLLPHQVEAVVTATPKGR